MTLVQQSISAPPLLLMRIISPRGDMMCNGPLVFPTRDPPESTPYPLDMTIRIVYNETVGIGLHHTYPGDRDAHARDVREAHSLPRRDDAIRVDWHGRRTGTRGS